MFEAFLKTLEPHHRARARKALETVVCHNGGDFLTRKALVERKIAEGARVGCVRGEGVLMLPSGAFMDARNITRRGLDYAVFLIESR